MIRTRGHPQPRNIPHTIHDFGKGLGRESCGFKKDAFLHFPEVQKDPETPNDNDILALAVRDIV